MALSRLISLQRGCWTRVDFVHSWSISLDVYGNGGASRLYSPLRLSDDGQRFHIEAYGVTGDNVVLPSLQMALTQPMITRHPYLVVEGNDESSITDLFPLLWLEPAREPNAWRTLVYDGAKIDLQRVRGDEPIRYIDIWSGQRNIAPADALCLSDLPVAITSLLEGTDNR